MSVLRVLCWCTSQKGVKRKVDAISGGAGTAAPTPAGAANTATNTSSAPNTPNSTYDPNFSAASQPQRDKSAGKVATRRESGRHVKKVNKDLPDAQVEFS